MNFFLSGQDRDMSHADKFSGQKGMLLFLSWGQLQYSQDILICCLYLNASSRKAFYVPKWSKGLYRFLKKLRRPKIH